MFDVYTTLGAAGIPPSFSLGLASVLEWLAGRVAIRSSFTVPVPTRVLVNCRYVVPVMVNGGLGRLLSITIPVLYCGSRFYVIANGGRWGGAFEV